MVLGLKNNATIDDTEVILEAKDDTISDNQKWLVVFEFDGWFKLINTLSGRFLTAANATSLLISGVL